MISLKLSVVVCWLAMVGLEAKPAPVLPVGTYSFTSLMGSNSIVQPQQQPAETTRTTSRGRVDSGGPADFKSYLPAVDTPEVQEAKEKFFNAFKQQTDLINEVREDGLWSAQPYADYYEDFEDAGQAENEYEEDEEEEEEGDGDEDEDEEEDEEDEDEEDSDEDSDSSSSSEEDSDEEDSDEDEDDEDEDEEVHGDEDEEEDEDEEDSDEDEEDSSSSSSSEEDGDDSSSSSSSEEDGDDSSSSSSSSSSEEDGSDPALLSMRALQALQPQQVEDTPEVQAAKQKFFDAYKAQVELVTNDV